MRGRKAQGPEASTQHLILDWLTAEHILAFRMNTGVLPAPSATGGKTRFVSFGVRGMADLVAFPDRCKFCRVRFTRAETRFCAACNLRPKVLWIETKSAVGRQRPEQHSFEEQVTYYGHAYLLARSLEDVLRYLGEG